MASFLTTSVGEHVPNPRHLAASAGRLAGAQQDLALKKRGSSLAVALVSALTLSPRPAKRAAAAKAVAAGTELARPAATL